MLWRSSISIGAMLVVAAVGGGAVGAWLVGGQRAEAQTGVFTGSEFRVVNARGETRATLGLAGGTANFRLADGEGRVRVTIGTTEEGTAVIRLGSEEADSITFGQLADGTQALFFTDLAGLPRVVLNRTNDGDANMRLFDAAGQEIWSILPQ